MQRHVQLSDWIVCNPSLPWLYSLPGFRQRYSDQAVLLGVAVYFVGLRDLPSGFYQAYLDGNPDGAQFDCSGSSNFSACDVIVYLHTGLENTEHNLTMMLAGIYPTPDLATARGYINVLSFMQVTPLSLEVQPPNPLVVSLWMMLLHKEQILLLPGAEHILQLPLPGEEHILTSE